MFSLHLFMNSIACFTVIPCPSRNSWFIVDTSLYLLVSESLSMSSFPSPIWDLPELRNCDLLARFALPFFLVLASTSFYSLITSMRFDFREEPRFSLVW